MDHIAEEKLSLFFFPFLTSAEGCIRILRIQAAAFCLLGRASCKRVFLEGKAGRRNGSSKYNEQVGYTYN